MRKLFTSRKSHKFSSIKERALTLRKCNKAVFIAPHRSEDMVTVPFISQVSKIVEAKGRETDFINTPDSRTRILSISRRLSQIDTSESDMDIIESIFKLQDAFIRLKNISSVLRKEPASVVFEMHALERDYQMDDDFEHVDHYFRIPGSRILFIRNMIDELGTPIKEGLKKIDAAFEKDYNRMFKILFEFEALNFVELEARYMDLLDILSGNIGRVAMIELPADADFILRIGRNPFNEDFEGIVNDITSKRKLTKFEEDYGLKINLAKTTITEEDAERVAGIVL